MSAGRSSTDLVAELRHQQDERVLEDQRARRRRRRRTIIGLVITVIVLAIAAVAGKIGWDRYQLKTALDEARTHLLAGTNGELELAAEAAERGLKVAPNDEDSYELLAMVRAHQAASSGDPAALNEALGELTDSDAAEVAVARGVAAAVAGDLDTVTSTLDKVEAGGDPPVARLRAWLHGTTALGQAYDQGRVDAALVELKQTAADENWAPLHRRYAAVLLAAGRIDDSLKRLETARGYDPADLGVATDEALTHAIVARHTGGVRDVAERLLEDETLEPRDRGRLHLARALVNMRKRKGAGVVEDIDAAWEHIPAWDADSRARVVESAFLAGKLDRGKALLDEIEPDEDTTKAYAAWAKLLEGDVVGSLDDCSKLPQTHPRVGYVQALALVEQKRFAESTPWIERSLVLYGPRLELRVAEARTKAHTADPKAAAKVLEEIAEGHHTARALTGLGEAQLLIAGEDGKTDDAEKTLREALDDEPRPAEAAFLLAGLVEKQAEDKPSKTPDVIALLEQAVSFDKSTVRYAASLGRYLAKHGTLAKADEVLRTLADMEQVPAASYVELVDVVLSRVELAQATLDKKEISGWLDKATTLGAPPVELAILRARLQLATRDDAVLEGVVASLAPILQTNPTHVEARLVYGETLRRRKDYANARAVLKEGTVGKNPLGEGQVLIARAAVERSDGSDRQAASIAWKGWLKIAQLDMPANDRMRLARETARFWGDIDNLPVQRSISKSVVDLVPWRADAWAFRALTQLADDKNEAGCINADKALKMDDKLAEAHSAKAECWISKHRYPDARKELSKAIKLSLSTAEKRAYKRRLRVLR